MQVLAVAAELYPLVKTGGLADVVGALPSALAPLGVEVATLLPGYPAVVAALGGAAEARAYPDLFGGPARVLDGRSGGLRLLAIDAPHLYTREGNPYTAPDGQDWPDNPLRFAALAAVANDLGLGHAPDLRPDIVHAHDWQAGLAPAYLHYLGGATRPGTVMTVHNLAFQGQVPRTLLGRLGLPPESDTPDGVEYYGAIGYLKAGLRFADRITTVSPTYAAEISTSRDGMGMDGLLRARTGAVSGILNGIDTAVWDPATDRHLPAPFSQSTLSVRGTNKAALQARLGLDQDGRALLFGVISRLTWQKGLDLLLDALPDLLSTGAQLALLGAGDAGLETGFRAAAAAHPGRIGVLFGYDEGVAHLLQGGSDAILVPSRFEPCGLTQLCALRYGALPVVARVGGLADTVIDANEMAVAGGIGTGMQFAPATRDALAGALHRVAALWQRPAVWQDLQRNAMRTDVSWRRPAERYAALYREILAERS